MKEELEVDAKVVRKYQKTNERLIGKNNLRVIFAGVRVAGCQSEEPTKIVGSIPT